MKFINTQYPNMTLRGENFSIKFENGVFETEDAKIIKILKDAGFDSDEKKHTKTNSK